MGTSTPEELHREFVRAFNAGDLDGVMRLYEPQATLVPQPGVVATGHVANRQALQQFLALKGTMTIASVYVIQSGDLALLRGDWQLNGKSPAGQPVEMNPFGANAPSASA